MDVLALCPFFPMCWHPVVPAGMEALHDREREGSRHYRIGKGRDAGTTGSGKGGMQALQDREREGCRREKE